METIFHEKQEGSLCAQHCLNALLQGEYFTAVDLATLARQIDEDEKERMAEGGVNSEAYRKFLEQPSGNVDDSGYFSVQVIAKALEVWGLELIPFKSQHLVAQSAQKDPTCHKAFICNYRDHWLTIRKIGHQWFNLNSLLSGPELLSNTHVALFLAQLIQEGYSIFVVFGSLPDCHSDRTLMLEPVIQVEKPYLLTDPKAVKSALAAQEKQVSPEDEDDSTLQQTLKLSLENSKEFEDQQLQAALSLSLTDYNNKLNVPEPYQATSSASSSSVEQQAPSAADPNCDTSKSSPEMTEEEMLEAALKMSMES